ncbi:uncharacterized protein LOC112500001 [Cynara cardunculus var. scolymus]|uniref:uncharacterized protein LOC112500001 n=1 Tax=Cynara cardunculus var. scolymus TaxID=59895 RepID=UPI000D6303E3|nr:uncharacterized protein LOC112500001 [Cynara cardunculus var. scolymus]
MAGDNVAPPPKNDGNTIDSNSPYYIYCSDYPRQMQGWLTTTMEKDIRSSVKHANTAAEIWSDLEKRFGKESAPRAYELKQTLTTTAQNGASVSAYYTKMRELWDEIQIVSPTPYYTCRRCTCDAGKGLNEAKEKERLYEFLMGLDNEFATIKTQTLASKPTPTLGTVYHLVAKDEQQRAIAATRRPIHEAAAFQSFAQNRREGTNDSTPQRNKGGTKEARCNDNDEVENCTFCGRTGHNKDGCFKQIGYPEWWPGKGKKEKGRPKAVFANTETTQVPIMTNEQYQELLKHFKNTNKEGVGPVGNMAGKDDGNNSWIVDTGAT